MTDEEFRKLLERLSESLGRAARGMESDIAQQAVRAVSDGFYEAARLLSRPKPCEDCGADGEDHFLRCPQLEV